jgi:hypothetical protein
MPCDTYVYPLKFNNKFELGLQIPVRLGRIIEVAF